MAVNTPPSDHKTSVLDESDEIELASAPALTAEQEIIVDLHSVINLIGVLHGCLELLQAEMVEGLENAKLRVYQLSQDIKSAAGQGRPFQLESTFPTFLAAEIECALQANPAIAESEDVIELRETIATVLEVFNVRLGELQARLSHPRAWVRFSTAQLAASIQQVLAAIEQNSRGRYRIVKNIAEQTPRDYQVDLDIASTRGDEFFMPPVLQDVLRDLIANARKYTPPGGRISAGLHSSEDGVRLVVEDNGVGIPRDELQKVVDFGYRASNVLQKRTLGGGFGLTKALWVAKNFGGRMWVRSRLGVGTRVTLFIPSQAGKA
ncbi:MAG: ATP-binding protein [Verrucomicrobiota bacterium]